MTMKNKFLKLHNPCDEKWENMKPNEKGSFCDSCSKNVIDFTKLNQNEISTILKKSSGNICARLTQRQLNTPLFETNLAKDYNLPFSNVAAGALIIAALTASHSAQSESIKLETEYVKQTPTELGLKSKKEQSKSKPSHKVNKEVRLFKGIVISEENGKPIENAKITFVTIEKIMSTYTLKDGSFSLEIPIEIIDNDNVVRVSYYEIINKNEKEIPFGYQTRDFILSKSGIETKFMVKAEREILYLGGLHYSSEERIPVVISNGQEIKYKDFIKARQGKKSSCNLENKDYVYFEPSSAIAIYGEKAKYGLYILTDKK